MTYPIPVRRERSHTRRALLALSTILASGLAAPSLAQTAGQAAIYQNIDGNGVDLTDGTFNMTIREGSIGSGEGAIELLRYAGSRGVSDNLTVSFNRSVTNGTVSIGLTFGDRQETFSGPATATNFTSGQGSGATLTKLGASSYRHTAADGTVTVYGPPPGLTNATNNGFCSAGNEFSCSLVAMSTVQPNGVRFDYEWDVGENCVERTGGNGEPVFDCVQFYRQRGMSNNLGYGVRFTFQQEANPTSGLPGNAWRTRASATLTNARVAGPARTVSYTYPSASVVQITDDGGRVWRLTYASSTGLVGIKRPGATSDSTVVTYGAGGVTAVTRDGITTNYNRAVTGNTATTTVTNALSQQTVITSDLAVDRPVSVRTADNQTTGFTYDASGRLTIETSPESNSRQYIYDARGNVTQAITVGKPGAGSPTLVTAYSYPAECANSVTCNLPETITDARGAVTNYTYDPAHGGLLSVKRPAMPNGTRPETRYGYSAIGGSGITMPTTVSECQTLASCANTVDERRTTITYGSPNLLPTVISTGSGNGALTATTTLSYNAAGDVISRDGPLPGVEDTTIMRYDAARRMMGAISPDPDGTEPLKRRAQRMTYNADDQVTLAEVGTVTGTNDSGWNAFSSLQQSRATYDGNGRQTRGEVTAGGITYNVVQYGYDALGRVECAALRMNPAAWGQLPSACMLGTEGTTGPDRITKTVYDEVGRVSSAIFALGTPQASTEISRIFWPNGSVKFETDAENNRTHYEYDAFDRPTRTYYPVAARGALAHSGSDYEQLGYDVNGNVVSRRMRDGAVIAYNYDALNRLSLKDRPDGADVTYLYDNLGRLLSATDANGHKAVFTYDVLGRKLSEGNYFYEHTFLYDLAGRRTRSTWSPDFHVIYDYLVTGEMSRIRENGATSGIGVLARFGYDDLGRRTSRTMGNGTSTAYNYDAGSRLTDMTLAGGANGNRYDFGYNPASQIVSRQGTNDAHAWAGHANADRGYTPDGLNRYSQAGSVTPSYDAKGNLTSFGTGTFEYTSENLLWRKDGSSTLYYDPLGRLDQIQGSNTLLAYDGAALTAEYPGGQLGRRYVHGPGVDEPLVWYQGSVRNWLDADERGSVTRITNDAGQQVAVNTYDEYGQPGAGNQGRFGYTGQKWIAELGLWDYKTRMYAPSLGRFMQTDPIGYGDGMNLYGYVGGDPVNLVDPVGLAAKNLPPAPNSLPQQDGAGSRDGDIVVTAKLPKPDPNPAFFGTGGGMGQSGGGERSDSPQKVNVDKTCANVPAANDPSVQAKALNAANLASTEQQRNPDGPPFREYGFTGRSNFFPSIFGEGYVTGDIQRGYQGNVSLDRGWFDTFAVHTHSGATGPSSRDVRNTPSGFTNIVIGRDKTVRCYTGN